MPHARYDTIGVGYARMRREAPRLRARILTALGDARTVLNVGAGTGAYEPHDRHVVAVEPSDVMAAQRPPECVPAIRATAQDLPLRDASVDAAMAVLTIHHWHPDAERGVAELVRVTRGPILIVTYDAAVASEMWLARDYLPEVAALDREIFPAPEQIAAWLGGTVEVEAWETPADTPDWTFGAFWAHPERVLEADARRATSGFARMSGSVVERALGELARDLASGAWDARYGALRERAALDVGVRRVIRR
jgi:SAM-dependent methyltransferase